MYIIVNHDGKAITEIGETPNLYSAYSTLEKAQCVAERLNGAGTIYRLVDVNLDCGDPATCAEPTCESYRESRVEA